MRSRVTVETRLFPGTVDHYFDALTLHGYLVSFHRLFEFESMSDEGFDVDPARSYHVKGILVSGNEQNAIKTI